MPCPNPPPPALGPGPVGCGAATGGEEEATSRTESPASPLEQPPGVVAQSRASSVVRSPVKPGGPTHGPGLCRRGRAGGRSAWPRLRDAVRPSR